MTLTKEWLLKTISELEEERDAIPGAVNEDAAMALAAMKMALAALTAEPVAYIDPFSLQNFATYRAGETDNKRMGREWMWADSDAGLVPVYAAPPAPVVPDQMPDSVYDILCQACGDKAWMYGDTLWNACRASMLQGAAGNSPAIPDGYALVPVEPTKEMVKKMRYYVGGYDRNIKDGYKAMLASAPQQEVKP